MVQVLIIGRDAEGWKRSLQTWSGLQVRAVTLPSAGIRTFEQASPDIVIVAEPPGSTRAEPMIQAIRERPLGQLVPLIWVAPANAGDADVEATSRVAPDVAPQRLVEELERHLEVQLGREPGSTAGSLAGESTAATTTTPPPGSVAGQPGGESGSVEVDRSAARRPGESGERGAARSGDAPAHHSGAGRSQQNRGVDQSAEPVEGRDYVVEPIDDEPPPTEQSPSHQSQTTGQVSQRSEPASDTERDSPTDGTFGGESTVFPVAGPNGGSQMHSGIEATDIERKIQEVRHQDYFAILEIGRDADGGDVRQAYDRLREQYHPDAIDGRLAQSYADDLREIADALTDAVGVLTDDDLRGAYLDATTRKS